MTNCTVCNGSGMRPGSSYLDCSCGLAEQRMAMNDFVSDLRADGFCTFADLHWAIHQRAIGIAEQADAARIAELEAKLADMRIWKPLTDVQWMNIVNHDHAYFGWHPEDAVHHAVKATEAKLAELNSMATQAPVREVPLPAAPTPSEVL